MTGADHNAERNDALARQLCSDALTWEAEPSAEAVGRLGRALDAAQSPREVRVRRLGMGLAALLVVGGLSWAWCGGLFAASEKPRMDAETAAVEPLQRELAALSQDATVFADAVWRGVPAPLRRLLHD